MRKVTKGSLRIGLIGTGFMGKAHVFGFASAPRVFDLPFALEWHTVADITVDAANRAATAFGFAHATADWRTIMANPEIDLVSITAPNALHREMALAAIAAGKHVYCEKPLAPLAEDAREMALAAEAAGVKTQVGFNYLCNPMMILARGMIEAGELGEIRGYRGIHCEDYMADAGGAFTFRHEPAGGGALADLGSHALATAEHLCGPITRVMGDCVTTIAERPDGKGGMRKVEVDDVGRAFLRFENGATGSVEGNWIATGPGNRGSGICVRHRRKSGRALQLPQGAAHSDVGRNNPDIGPRGPVDRREMKGAAVRIAWPRASHSDLAPAPFAMNIARCCAGVCAGTSFLSRSQARKDRYDRKPATAGL